LKEYAPHILEQSKQKSVGKSLSSGPNASTPGGSNKDVEVVNIIQQIYKQ